MNKTCTRNYLHKIEPDDCARMRYSPSAGLTGRHPSNHTAVRPATQKETRIVKLIETFAFGDQLIVPLCHRRGQNNIGWFVLGLGTFVQCHPNHTKHELSHRYSRHHSASVLSILRQLLPPSLGMTTPYSFSSQINGAVQPHSRERRRSSVISIPGDDDLAASADFMPLSMFPEPHRSNKDEAAVPASAPANVYLCAKAEAEAGQHVQAMTDTPMMPAGAAAACHPPDNPMESGVPPPAAANDGVPKTAEEIERAQLYVQEQIKKVEAQQQELRLLQEKTQREALATQQIQQRQQHQQQFNFNMMQYQAQQQQQQHMNVPYPNSTMVQDQQGSAAPHTPHTYAMGAPAAAAATFGTDDSHSASALGSHVANTNTVADQSRQGTFSGGSVGSGSRSGSSSPGLNGNKKRHSDPNLLSSEASKKTKIAKVVATGIPSLLGRKVSEVVDLQNDSTDGTRKHAYTRVVGSTNYRSRPDPTHEKEGGASESPQDYLNATLRSRGYSTTTATSFDCGYPSQPTALQRSSYGVAVLRAVQKSNADALSKLLQAGLSPNPCNAHGDSVLQMVCKRSDVKLFQTFLDNGIVLEIADPFGRTPLHFAAWAPASDDTFEIVTAMLDRVGTDILRVTDKNGKTPLQYLTVDKWPRWMSYLESKRDVYFLQREPGDKQQQIPPRCSNTLEGEVPDESSPDHDMKEVTVVDPPNSLSPEVAALVASGKVRPEDAREKATANITPEA